MAIKIDLEHNNGFLELTTSGEWNHEVELHAFIEEILDVLYQQKPKALLWKTGIRRYMDLGDLIKLSVGLRNYPHELVMAYIANDTIEGFDHRNLVISKKLITQGKIQGQIFYDEEEGREWLKQAFTIRGRN